MSGDTRAKLLALGITITVLAIWAALPASPVMATRDSHAIIHPTPRTCGGCGLISDPFGIATDQTARLNILNRGEERGLIINWKFLDSEGNTLGESLEPLSVAPGQMVSDDFFADGHSVVRDRFGRVQTRAVISVVGNPDEGGRNLQISLEVFDNATGKTTFTAKFCSNNL